MTKNQLNLINTLFAHTKTSRDNLKFWLILLAFSFFTIFAMGRVGADLLMYGLWLYLSLYVLRRLSNTLFIGYLIFTAIVSVLYLPIAVMYGKLTKGIAYSLFETSVQESFEFLSSVDLKSGLYILLYLALFTYLLKVNKKVTLSTVHGKGFYVLSAIVIISIIFKPVRLAIKEKSLDIAHLVNMKYYPIRQVVMMNHSLNEYLNNQKILQEAREIDPVWNFEDKTLKYNTYVLVIGESMRRDYMSAYGYPIDTTPFLANTNGTIFNDFITPGQNTRLSLERMLFQNKAIEQGIVSNTPVTLANSLGMDTYWLSNQGVYSDYDVFASSVAVRSDNVQFLNSGKGAMEAHSDFELLPKFEEIMVNSNNSKNNNSKLIVVHLVGSHWNFCERLDPNYQIENITGKINSDMSCYLSTYRQTDTLLEKMYTSLEKNTDSFSLMYLSDHGLAHKDRAMTGVVLRHGTEYKQNYDVPFIVLSSDDTQRTYIDAKKSGYYFMNGFAEWLGIKEKNMILEPKFFANVSDEQPRKVFNGEKVVAYESLKDDPAIVK